VFRGSPGVTVGVKMIPAQYSNTIEQGELTGYRLQFDSVVPGSSQTRDSYMHASTSNEASFTFALTSSSVQLDTEIRPVQTLLSLWGIMGGLVQVRVTHSLFTGGLVQVRVTHNGRRRRVQSHLLAQAMRQP
jgi:hypothetical protein